MSSGVLHWEDQTDGPVKSAWKPYVFIFNCVVFWQVEWGNHSINSCIQFSRTAFHEAKSPRFSLFDVLHLFSGIFVYNCEHTSTHSWSYHSYNIVKTTGKCLFPSVKHLESVSLLHCGFRMKITSKHLLWVRWVVARVMWLLEWF